MCFFLLYNGFTAPLHTGIYAKTDFIFTRCDKVAYGLRMPSIRHNQSFRFSGTFLRTFLANLPSFRVLVLRVCPIFFLMLGPKEFLCGTTFWQLFDYCLATFWQLFDNFLTPFWQLFESFLSTFWQLFGNFVTHFYPFYQMRQSRIWSIEAHVHCCLV
jgi:hypothetical protein